MTTATLQYRWSEQEFLRADAAGVFDGRVELVDGEVWPVVIGRWHGVATACCARLLHTVDVVVTTESLATGGSLPDPDVWIRPVHATETSWLSPRVSRWQPADVLLVVEVSDETVTADLSVKARLYGAAGYAVYWVVTRDGVHEHTGPAADGYTTVRRYRAGESIPLPYANQTVAVDDLLGDAAS